MLIEGWGCFPGFLLLQDILIVIQTNLGLKFILHLPSLRSCYPNQWSGYVDGKAWE